MRAIPLMGLAVVVVGCMAGIVVSFYCGRRQAVDDTGRLHVVLIGASIGQSWNLSGWSERTQMSGVTAESVANWQFDKSEAIEDVLMRPARKVRPTRTYLKSLLSPPQRRPDVVILKECSSYFPGHIALYKEQVQMWVARIRERNIRIVLATVVPVTRARAAREMDKQNRLLEFNRWVREYAQKEGLALLDLESTLREEGDSFFLRDDFAARDGSHLNPRAYAVLDKTLQRTLCAMEPRAGCEPSRAR